MKIYKTRKAFVISSLLIFTSAFMAAGLGANQAFGDHVESEDSTQKTCDTENGFKRLWVDSHLVPLEFRADRSSQWICLNSEGRNNVANNEPIQLSGIGNYIVRDGQEVHEEYNQRTEGFDDVGNVLPEPTTDWENKYYDVLSKFNKVSIKVGELQEENEFLRGTQSGELQIENDNLKAQILVLTDKINNLDAIIMEQLDVIYKWVVGNDS